MDLFEIENNFQIIFNDKPVKVETLFIGKDTMYLAKFVDQPPLFLARALDANQVRFWTSVPEGRQKLAEAIGELIAEHIRQTL